MNLRVAPLNCLSVTLTWMKLLSIMVGLTLIGFLPSWWMDALISNPWGYQVSPLFASASANTSVGASIDVSKVTLAEKSPVAASNLTFYVTPCAALT